ncbi:altronate dehydratase family protein [Alloacidobacterium sp.]|uniref:UxaA family hydrolase n=1 Tax=Alloacidobacterium sp. TaxID=2951999 RepID=UPI002D33A8EA|nr:altronate dehydratase family protein [Alloacidobacterium sp.]HYK35615.1 altronate dehydratase family protein [Alloacidobacterium sp.]
MPTDLYTIPTTKPPLIRLHAADNVAVARVSLSPGIVLSEFGISMKTPIPTGHKIALKAIAAGEAIFKYGQVIGHATRPIEAGEHVHSNNLAITDLHLRHEFCVDAVAPEFFPEADRATFLGFKRSDGRVGTRNYLAILSSVNCSATVSHAIARHFSSSGELDAFSNVDGVAAFTHGGGCAMDGQGEGYHILTRTMAGFARHPNVGAVLMVGLGCETNQIPAIVETHSLTAGPTLRTMTIQATGGTRKTIEAGIEAVRTMLPALNAQRRSVQQASELVLALECGGSDGYSGISANPALGFSSDLLVRHGGTAVLAETPEIYGAEHLLTRRAATPEVAQKLLDRIEWWRDYAARNKGSLDNNPSHGNKAGGLTTILEKSLGAVTKGGMSRLEAVYEYAERVTKRGFVFMDTPGYDPVAVTGQIAGGCNMLCFTTGRGSTTGYKPVPCIKLATNTPMYERMTEDMDLNCGEIVTGEKTIEEIGRQIFDKILAVASGERTRSEQNDYGDYEFVPWQVGAVM